jgi:hypothetical protein
MLLFIPRLPDAQPSQAKLPLYLDFFQLVHNARKRGKALLSALFECLLC